MTGAVEANLSATSFSVDQDKTKPTGKDVLVLAPTLQKPADANGYVTVIGELITSTLLTLVVVPVAYTYFDDMGNWVKRKLMSEERVKQLEHERQQAGMTTEKLWGAPKEAEV